LLASILHFKQRRKQLTKQVDVEVVLKLHDPAFSAGLEVNDGCTVLGRGCHIRTLDGIGLAAVRDSQLVFLVRASVDDEHLLVVILLPGEYLCGRVEQVDTTDIVIGHVVLGIASVERKLTAKLRDSQVAGVGRKGDGVVGVFKRVESSVSDHEELGDVAIESSDGEVGITSVAAIDVGVVLVLCCQVGRRCLDEVGLELGFAVLLAVDKTLLGDDCGIVVAGVTTRVTKVAP